MLPSIASFFCVLCQSFVDWLLALLVLFSLNGVTTTPGWASFIDLFGFLCEK